MICPHCKFDCGGKLAYCPKCGSPVLPAGDARLQRTLWTIVLGIGAVAFFIGSFGACFSASFMSNEESFSVLILSAILGIASLGCLVLSIAISRKQ